MELSCPNCGVCYAVSGDDWLRDTGDGGGLALRPRKVRCSVCQEVWVGTPQPKSAAEDILLLDEPMPPEPVSPPDGERAAGAPSRRGRWLAGGVAGLVLLAGGTYAAIATGRLQPADVGLKSVSLAGLAMPSMPDALRGITFPELKLPELRLPRVELPVIRVPETPPPPLALEGDAIKKRLPQGGSAWEISGTLHNPTSQTQPVPAIQFTMLNASNQPVGGSTIHLKTASLAPGDTLEFDTTSMNPPENATQVRLELKSSGLARR